MSPAGGGEPVLAIDEADNIVMGWMTGEQNGYFEIDDHVIIRRWDGSRWEHLGFWASGFTSSGGFGLVAVAVAKGRVPIIAYADDQTIVVRRYVDSEWQELAGADTVLLETASQTGLSLATTPNGDIIVGGGGGVHRWNSTGWQQLSSNTFSDQTALAISSNGEIFLAHTTDGELHVNRWDGASWAPVGAVVGGAPSAWASEPALVITEDGTPVVAWTQQSSDSSNILLRYWTGSAWEELMGSGSGDGLTPGTGGREPSLVPGVGEAFVLAWEKGPPTDPEVGVVEWTGNAWRELAGIIPSSQAVSGPRSARPALARAADGTPHLAWQSRPAVMGGYIYLRSWTGASWEELPGSVSGNGLSATPGHSASPVLAVDNDCGLVASWSERANASVSSFSINAKHWDGEDWRGIGASAEPGGIDGPGDFRLPRLAVSPAGVPFTAWSTENDVRLLTWNGSNWTPFGGATVVGHHTEWGPVDLTVTPEGDPVVAWADPTTVVQWSNGEWMPLAGLPADGLSEPSIATTSSGTVVAAWRARGSVVAYRYVGDAWELLAGAGTAGELTDTTAGRWARGPALAIGGADTPTIAFTVYTPPEATSSDIEVAVWEGGEWRSLGNPSRDPEPNELPSFAVAPSLGIDVESRPVVAWSDSSGPDGSEIFVARFQDREWVSLDGSRERGGISNSAGWSRYPSLVATPVVCVAWQDAGPAAYEIMLRCHR